ncbi:MAG: hypothetical protein GF308_16425 [Candidatus Heimdallarchaeota archaeon]|nr:hypothetical protein [Candidatus Heimdallarchaeota archaeon]
MSATSYVDHKLISFDEFRDDINQMKSQLDLAIKNLKKKTDEGDTVAKILLYLLQGLFSILEGEKKFQEGDFKGGALAFDEGEKMINRFQRMGTGFSVEYQQQAERLDLFAKGRYAESLALQQETTFDDKITQLLEAKNSYTLEAEINKRLNEYLLNYNARARSNFTQGLVDRLKGENWLRKNRLREAKQKHLEAYRSFSIATYFNPSYRNWVQEQEKLVNNTLKRLLVTKAQKIWGQAYDLSSEGLFLASSEKCNIASKLYKRASNLTNEPIESKIWLATYYMLQSSRHEAQANESLKNRNDPAQAAHYFNLASEAMEQAVTSYPTRGADQASRNRWAVQQQYYLGSHFNSQGISKLDQEDYEQAITLFEQAQQIFSASLKTAQDIEEKTLIKLLEKSLAEAKGYIGMCKTVLD